MSNELSGGKRALLWICILVSLLAIFSMACSDDDIASIKAEPGELKKDAETQVREFRDLAKSFDYPHTE